MTRLADFAAHVVRWAFHLSAAIALTGCFASNTPTISRSEAEDVGRTLQYWMWNDEELRSDLLQFVRQDGKEYQLQLGGIDQAPLDPFANGIYIRQFGTRNAGPIYLVQFDLEHFDLDPDIKPEYYGFRYFSYLVAIDAGGNRDCWQVLMRRESRNRAGRRRRNRHQVPGCRRDHPGPWTDPIW